ncbi:hypothetical protein [Acuticoccus sediminis]|uniref:hypothetical protein n=1 Tax=Acuticoccus sediminis TaxID=2184697 RepID=UPI001CFCBDE3|nr:hypothetical protein [Acuticoccus sediminis]
MRCRLRLAAPLAGLLAAVQCAAIAMAQPGDELKPALTAEVTLTALDGTPAAPIAPHEPFAVTVTITGHGGGEAPKGLTLFGWLRRQKETDLPCAETAEAFLRTGRLSTGTVFLNDPVIGVLTEDDAVTLVDPEFSLATANLLAASRLGSRPATLVTDEHARRFLLPLSDEGRLVAVDAAGSVTEVARDLGRPVTVVPVPGGGAVVQDAAARRLVRVPEGPSVPPLVADGLAGGAHDAAAVWGTEGAAAFSLRDGAVMARTREAATAAAVLARDGKPFALLTAASGGRLAVHYLDDPRHPVAIDVPVNPRRLAVAGDGRFVVAYDPAGGPVAIVDVARSALVQVSHARDRDGTEVPVSEVMISDRTAYLMLADQSRVGVLDLVALGRGEEAEFREVPIGEKRATPRVDDGLLASLYPDHGVLALNVKSRQAYRIAEASAMGNAPAMTATKLMGGVPRRIATLDRSFREAPAGTFRTVASLPGPGRWELVATTGLGSLSFCSALPVATPDDPDAPLEGRIAAVAAEDGTGLRFRLSDGSGAPLAVRGVLTFSEFTGAWRERVPIRTGTDGTSSAVYTLPPGSLVAVTVAAPGGHIFEPIVLEEGSR